MSTFPEPAQPAPPDPPVGERPARLAKFKREQLTVDHLNRGVSVAEIAARFDMGEKRVRAIIREVLARPQLIRGGPLRSRTPSALPPLDRHVPSGLAMKS
jgi:DNA-binding NarL/FixJ family response regulator